MQATPKIAKPVKKAAKVIRQSIYQARIDNEEQVQEEKRKNLAAEEEAFESTELAQ